MYGRIIKSSLRIKVKKSKEAFNLTHAVMAAEVVLLAAAGIFMFTASGYSFFSEIAQSLSL